MRYHLDILKDLQDFLSENNLTIELQSLHNEVLASSTGGELCMRVGSWLLTFRVTNRKDALGMDKLITEFIDYCHFNGLFPIPIK
ncbi:MAG TPA: hypothetical protein VK543_03850 [Puia sp.]|nr:hypothetical protein [Puia sp.]